MLTVLEREYDILADDFIAAGEASSSVRKILNQLGIDPKTVKRAAIANV